MKKLRARRRRQFWTKGDIAIVRRLYARTDTAVIAAQLGRTVLSVYQQANDMGLRKNPELVTAKNRELGKALLIAGAAHRFPKGHVPANKGLRRPGWFSGRMRETQFKKGCRSGQAARNWVPIGSHRINGDGYLDRKITDSGRGPRDWEGVHRLVWIAAHGPIPPGHVVVFKPGRRTTKLKEITLDALELITRAELMRRNSYHTNYPKELAQIIQLRGALQRQINMRERHAKQN